MKQPSPKAVMEPQPAANDWDNAVPPDKSKLIPHITNRINGQPAPVMTRATEEKLRSMFKEIQGPFLKHCPPERKNFLSYSYVLHKFCQLLGLDHFLPCFPLLKSREKLHLQDVIWENICRELRWEFIKSV